MNNTIIIYTLLNFLVLFFFGKISYRLNLVDIPNNRKIHSKATAYTGGIAISIILLFAIMLTRKFYYCTKIFLIQIRFFSIITSKKSGTYC